MGINLQGMTALLVLTLACIFTLVLIGVAMYELGRYLIDLNRFDCRTCD